MLEAAAGNLCPQDTAFMLGLDAVRELSASDATARHASRISCRVFSLLIEADPQELTPVVRLTTSLTRTCSDATLVSPVALPQAGSSVEASPHHLVATFGSETLTLFLDGAPVARKTLRGSLRAWPRLSHVTIGNSAALYRGCGGAFFKAALWRRALGADEVARLHGIGPEANQVDEACTVLDSAAARRADPSPRSPTPQQRDL